mmetsp:Transcript_17970/g.39041  ORF Transcript_17970/g.39041 Transcript_17970/m.39041 type:complete len:126 (-) Transcript_17970:294-671(-)
MQMIHDVQPPVYPFLAPHDTVIAAVNAMADHNLGCCLVEENGTLLGAFSERDYFQKIITQGRSSLNTQVSEVMTTSPTTVAATDTFARVLEVMVLQRIRHLPVVNGSVLGVVSARDLLRLIVDYA